MELTYKVKDGLIRDHVISAVLEEYEKSYLQTIGNQFALPKVLAEFEEHFKKEGLSTDLADLYAVKFETNEEMTAEEIKELAQKEHNFKNNVQNYATRLKEYENLGTILELFEDKIAYFKSLLS